MIWLLTKPSKLILPVMFKGPAFNGGAHLFYKNTPFSGAF